MLDILHLYFYRTQESLGSGLWVSVSLSMSHMFFDTLLMWLWLMMITQYYWWCQYKAIPGYLYSMTYMQVALANGQSKIVGTLEVNWNISLITRNKGIRKPEIPLIEFCKNNQREQTTSTMLTQHVSWIWCHQADVDAYFWPQSQLHHYHKFSQIRN